MDMKHKVVQPLDAISRNMINNPITVQEDTELKENEVIVLPVFPFGQKAGVQTKVGLKYFSEKGLENVPLAELNCDDFRIFCDLCTLIERKLQDKCMTLEVYDYDISYDDNGKPYTETYKCPSEKKIHFTLNELISMRDTNDRNFSARLDEVKQALHHLSNFYIWIDSTEEDNARIEDFKKKKKGDYHTEHHVMDFTQFLRLGFTTVKSKVPIRTKNKYNEWTISFDQNSCYFDELPILYRYIKDTKQVTLIDADWFDCSSIKRISTRFENIQLYLLQQVNLMLSGRRANRSIRFDSVYDFLGEGPDKHESKQLPFELQITDNDRKRFGPKLKARNEDVTKFGLQTEKWNYLRNETWKKIQKKIDNDIITIFTILKDKKIIKDYELSVDDNKISIIKVIENKSVKKSIYEIK